MQRRRDGLHRCEPLISWSSTDRETGRQASGGGGVVVKSCPCNQMRSSRSRSTPLISRRVVGLPQLEAPSGETKFSPAIDRPTSR